jgi:hypothetical protein
MKTVVIDKGFVSDWSQRYLVKLARSQRADEDELLNDLGPRVRDRGYYTRSELERVNRWKLPTQRNRKGIARNSDSEIEMVTKEALAAPEHFQLYILVGWLYGVSDAVASAFLMVSLPDNHTVIDFRAARALEALQDNAQLPMRLPWRPQAPDSGWSPPYLPYLDVCQRLAKHLGVSLRDLDRALWRWHKEQMPPERPN